MKKLLIASVSMLALSAGAAFADPAQNWSALSQNGASNGATLTQQLNGGTLNTSTINQGLNSTSYSPSYEGATVTQIGSANSTISSGVQQDDYYQTATVSQTGNGASNLTSNITQSNYQNTATVTQLDVNGGMKQNSGVTQSGQYGLVTVSQRGSNDQSSVTQSGYANNSNYSGLVPGVGLVSGGVSVEQSGGNALTNISNVTQTGSYSGAALTQSGSANGTNYSSVTQAGQSDFASVSQTGGTYIQSLLTQNG